MDPKSIWERVWPSGLALNHTFSELLVRVFCVSILVCATILVSAAEAEKPVLLIGTIKAVTVSHAGNGEASLVPILQLRQPRRFTAIDSVADELAAVGEFQQVHLFDPDAAIDFASRFDRKVIVSGALFAAHTAHHHAPVVMVVHEITY